MAYLECLGLRRTYGPLRAVDDASLSVERGEFVGVLGPSGSGKTTWLRLVAGFEWAEAGSIRLDGQDVTHLSPQKRQMGMVFQSYALFPNMTARQNVAFGLRVRRMQPDAIRERVGELLDLVGLLDKAERLPHQLSGGEQQRVALARALAPRPRVLLLDEPLSALDARIRVNLRQEIRRIQRQLAITTLYVTHDQEEALSMSDRVAVFRAGRIEQVGQPQEIYDHPASPFVGEFVGTMNRLEAQALGDARCAVDGQPLDVAGLPPHLRAGDAFELRIRPEQIRLTSGEGGGHLRATVEDVMFRGDRLAVRANLGHQAVWIDLPRAAGAPRPAIGDAVDLQVSPSALGIGPSATLWP